MFNVLFYRNKLLPFLYIQSFDSRYICELHKENQFSLEKPGLQELVFFFYSPFISVIDNGFHYVFCIPHPIFNEIRKRKQWRL